MHQSKNLHSLFAIYGLKIIERACRHRFLGAIFFNELADPVHAAFVPAVNGGLK